jgi:putative acetyltransferase
VSYRLRSASPEDFSALQQLYAAAVRGLAIEAYSPAQCEAWAAQALNNPQWPERLASAHVCLAEDENDVIAGFIAWNEEGHIDLLFTAPAHARSGVATWLYTHAEAALRAEGVSRLHTEASRLAQPFFSKHGFRIKAEESIVRNGESLQRFVMSKQL